MDTAGRRPQLPALGLIDHEKARREEEIYQGRHAGATSHLASAPATSPSYQYPPGPPPPYSHPPPHAHHYTNDASVHTPPDSRRTSGDTKEDVRQTIQRSLPSISEALGVESRTAYTAAAPPSVLAPSALQPQLPPVAPVSPVSAHARPYGPVEPHSQQAYTYHQAPPPPSQLPPASVEAPPARHFAQEHEQQPLQPLRTAHSPVARCPHSAPGYPYPPPNTTSTYEQQGSISAGAMAPPAFPYGYTPYPPRGFAQPTPPNGSTSGPVYQPSLTHAAPLTPSWKPEHSRHASERSVYAHTDSVKRHLDWYDFEASLNELVHNSSSVNEFARRYGDRLHQTARSGPTPSTLPSVFEVEDMIVKTRAQADSLAKIREVVVAQQAAFDLQAQERQQQHKVYPSSAPLPADHSDLDETKTDGGFAGSDAKKRRGRAAPPGRCHSCNRAETPEWRRGPDGARTLCNACGLHYAKLTRKQNQANKGAAAGSSNLRPKDA